MEPLSAAGDAEVAMNENDQSEPCGCERIMPNTQFR